MKETLKSIKLRRQNSTKSLATDLQIQTELSRVGSSTSLKSLGKDLIKSFKKKGNDNISVGGDNDSFEEGWLSMKSKKFGRRIRYCFKFKKIIFQMFQISIL